MSVNNPSRDYTVSDERRARETHTIHGMPLYLPPNNLP